MQRLLFKIVKGLFYKLSLYIETELPIKYFGSSYGGWYVSEKNLSNNLTVLSAGVGEDISFDIEIMNSFKSKIFFIDPTPKAIAHINNVLKSLGNHKTKKYNEKSGKQNIESYDLSKIQVDDFLLIKKALYNKSNFIVKFFKPQNEQHVSHSISNFQNQFKKNSEYIEVTTTTIQDIVSEHKISHIDILKLDIEGAENQVIPYFLKRKIYPKQLLVEFDELSTGFIMPYLKALFIFIKLNINSYKLVKTEDFPNFLFIRENK